MIGDREVEALEAVRSLAGDEVSLRTRISSIEAALSGLPVEEATVVARELGATTDLLRGALLVKSLAGQINVVIHAVGILEALPYVLAADERVLALSLGPGNSGRDWDLETDRQIAEFKFIRWRGHDAIRQNTLFVDLFHLAEAHTDKRRVMYITGIDHPRRFLAGRRRITSILEKHGAVARAFEQMHGDRYKVVSEYWATVENRVEIIDLEGLVHGLVTLASDGE